MSNDLFRAVWTTPGNWREGRHVRIAICTTALICSFVLPGQAPSGPLAQHVQEGPALLRMDWRCGKSDDPRIRRQPWYGAALRRNLSPAQARPPRRSCGNRGRRRNHSNQWANSGSFARFCRENFQQGAGPCDYLTTYRNGELLPIKLTLGYSNCELRSGAHRNSKTRRRHLRSSSNPDADL
jgi:hypothetical protein